MGQCSSVDRPAAKPEPERPTTRIGRNASGSPSPAALPAITAEKSCVNLNIHDLPTGSSVPMNSVISTSSSRIQEADVAQDAETVRTWRRPHDVSQASLSDAAAIASLSISTVATSSSSSSTDTARDSALSHASSVGSLWNRSSSSLSSLGVQTSSTLKALDPKAQARTPTTGAGGQSAPTAAPQRAAATKAKARAQAPPAAAVPPPPSFVAQAAANVAIRPGNATARPAMALAPNQRQSAVAIRLTVPLQPPVMGLQRLLVREVPLAETTDEHVSWLLEGWVSVAPLGQTQQAGGSSAGQPSSSADAGKPAKAKGKEKGKGKGKGKQQAISAKGQADVQQAAGIDPYKVIGFDTEFIGDQLALVQLCCGDRALLVRVPRQRTAEGVPLPLYGTRSSGRQGGAGRRQGDHPFECPPCLERLFTDPNIAKAAAEAWQDAIMVYAAFGVKLRCGKDLTVACPPNEEEKKRGRKKLSLFDIFARYFPDSTLRKDHTIDHDQWFASRLTDKQVQYAALDAFVSYAAGVRAPMHVSPVDLAAPKPWELALAAQWVLTYQFSEMDDGRTEHDFHSAEFKDAAKGLLVEVRMSRFKNRLRKGCFVEMHLPDGRRISGRCVHVHGRTAHVGKLKWVGSAGRDVKMSEVSTVTKIEMEDNSETGEEEAIRRLINEVLRGQRSLATGAPLVGGVFGGASLKASNETIAQASRARGTVSPQLAALRSAGRINDSQHRAIEEVLLGDRAVQLVQGPPGTGKTTVIAHAVQLWVRHMAPGLPKVASGSSRKEQAMACVARSNVAARNIALALLKRGLGPQEFRLVVSQDFHFEWHEEHYRGKLQDVLIVSDELNNYDMPRALEGIKVFVTTASMLSSAKFQRVAFYQKALTRLLVDEASQIYAADLVLPLVQYGQHMRSLSLFGDDQQLPPYGSQWDGAQIPSMFNHLTPPAFTAVTTIAIGSAGGHAGPRTQPNAFTVGPHLVSPQAARAEGAAACGAARLMLAVSYRLPVQLCSFISREVYTGQLQSGRPPPSGVNRPAVRWMDVVGQESNRGGTSMCNPVEAEMVCRLVAREFAHTDTSWTVLTTYDLQRSVLEKEVAKQRLPARAHPHPHPTAGPSGRRAARASASAGPSHRAGKGGKDEGSDRVYNVDTFQGREDEVILLSLVRCGKKLGSFLEDDRRMNVAFTRCTRQLVVVGSLALALQVPESLVGRMAAFCRDSGTVEAPPPR